MICDVCKKVVDQRTYIDNKAICDMCNYLLFGKLANSYYNYPLKTEDSIILWIKDYLVVNAWKDNGQTSIYIGNNNNPLVILDIIRNGKRCSECGKEVEVYSGTHFAGKYCNDCWIKYKEKYKGICKLCNKPYYECTC